MLSTSDNEFAAFNEIEGVQVILRVLCRVTGMRIGLVARIAEDTWTACAVLDEANFGIKPGDHLELHTTY